jgi:CheY-like chemotaxis protein
MDGRQVAHLLHVEDDDLCIMALARAFKKAAITNPVRRAHDGLVALDILRGANGRERIPCPLLILLDLSMPRMDGIEFLQELRGDQALKRSIVFVMTSSNAMEDKIKAYNLGIAGYLLKTANAFAEAAALLRSYWRVVDLPSA